MLTSARIPFDFVHEQDLSEKRLSRYALLILPNVALMSDLQVAALADYAAKGCSILGTFESGLYDENGKPRADFALARLLGIHKAGDRTHSEPRATQTS